MGGSETNLKTAKILGIVGIALVIVSSGASIFRIATGATELAALGPFDFVVRTGGRLQEPDSEDNAYPLTHTIYNPGNMTMAEMPEFREFTIFYQVAFGFGLLVNGSQASDTEPKLDRTSYDIRLNLTTNIEVDAPGNLTVLPLDQITNFHLNESTAQQVILTKGIGITIITAETALDLDYYLTRTLNNDSALTSELTLTSRINRTDLDDAMNITLRSEWTAYFASPGVPELTYTGNVSVGSFRIDKKMDFTYGLNGVLRCYFENQHVSVLQGWDPLLEIAVAAVGVVMLTVYLRFRYRIGRNG